MAEKLPQATGAVNNEKVLLLRKNMRLLRYLITLIDPCVALLLDLQCCLT
jgi:hypothetical protein